MRGQDVETARTRWIVPVVCLIAASCGDNRAGPAADGGVDGDHPPPPLWCDDQNACTDDRVEDGMCRFVAVEDGRPCDDGDFCTLGDRCQVGRCVSGTRSEGSLAHLGTLASSAGGTIAVVGDRFVTVSSPSWSAHVRLAERRGANLEVLAAWDGRLELLSGPQEALVQALDGDVIAIGGRQERSLAMFSVSAVPSLVRRGDAMLDGQLVSVTGRGHQIWACTRDFFRGFEVALVDVSDPDAPSIVGSIRMPIDCGSVDISDDGRRIYVNTQDGVRFIDASPLESGGNPTLSDVFAPPAGVRTAPGYLILRERSAVRVLLQSDHSEVAAIAVSGVLAASLIGERLLLEGWRTTSSGGMEAFAALYDALGANPPARLDEVVLQRVSFQGDVGPSFHNAVLADGSTVVTAIGQRMFDLTGGRFDEVRVAALTPLDHLMRTIGGVRAVGYTSSAVVDAGAPQSPVFAGGGSFGVPVKFEATLEESTPWPQVLFGDRSDVPRLTGVGRSWEPNPLPVEHWTLDTAGRPQRTGTFLLPNSGAGQLLTADSKLYRMRSPVAPAFEVTLQGWPVSALGHAGELAQPAFELQLVPAPPFAASRSGRGVFDVDARTGMAVVATGISDGPTRDTALFWVDLTATPPRIVEQVRLDGRPDEIRVSGTRAVISTFAELIWLELGKGQVARQTPSAETLIDHLLGFDGRTVYYTFLDLSSAPSVVGIGTAAFGQSGPASARLPIGDTALTMVEIDGALALGMPNQLVTMRPQCE